MDIEESSARLDAPIRKGFVEWPMPLSRETAWIVRCQSYPEGPIRCLLRSSRLIIVCQAFYAHIPDMLADCRQFRLACHTLAFIRGLEDMSVVVDSKEVVSRMSIEVVKRHHVCRLDSVPEEFKAR